MLGQSAGPAAQAKRPWRIPVSGSERRFLPAHEPESGQPHDFMEPELQAFLRCGILAILMAAIVALVWDCT